MQVPHLRNFYDRYQQSIEKQYQVATPELVRQVRYLELIGSKCLHTTLMKIVLIELKLSDPELFEASKGIYAKLETALQPNAVSRELVHRMFYHLHLDYTFTSVQLIESVEKEVAILVREIVATHRQDAEKSAKIVVKPYHSVFAARHSPEKKPQSNGKEMSSDPTTEKVEIYLDKEVSHPKTELTEFCHQMRITEPTYLKKEQAKIFKIQCLVNIPEDRTEFRSHHYNTEAFNMNSKLAMMEAARKILKCIYCENPTVWERFREIKRAKKIKT